MEKQVLFKPKAKGYFNRSPLYAVPMFLKTMTLSSRYLMHSLKKPLGVAGTDEYVAMFWRLHFEESKTSLSVTGRELLQPGETYIFMSNHESWMDIPAMFGAVPTSLRMVAKIGLTKVPIFGQALVNAGFIAVDRKNRRRAIKQLGQAKTRLEEGVSIWIAPEGTRTRSGTIGPFKKGGFYLAKELEKSIVPVFIEGAAEVMPADSLMVRPNREIIVHFLKPVDREKLVAMSIQELADNVRTAILSKQQECELAKAKK